MRDVESIGSIIENVVSKLNVENKINKANLFNHWREIVGEEISKRTKPKKLIKGLLFVSVTTSTWANELSLMSDQLIDKINSYVGRKVVKEIRFRPDL